MHDNKRSKRIKLLDGSFFEALKRCGYDADKKHMWTSDALLEDPTACLNAHKLFVDVGVDYLTTNTYHLNSVLLKQSHPDILLKDLFKKAFEIAQIAIDTKDTTEMLISIGSFATTLRDCSEYNGNYVDQDGIQEKIKAYYKEQLEITDKLGKKIIVETVPAGLEVECLLEVLKEIEFEKKVIICVTCKNDSQLRHGEDFAEIAQKILTSPQVYGLGINCTDMGNIQGLLSQLPSQHGKQVFVYPNSGYENSSWSKMEDLDKLLSVWVASGTTVIGGCCGTHIEDLKKISSVLKKLNSQ